MNFGEKAIDKAPAIRLLLSCARTGMSAEVVRECRSLLRAGIDWDYLLETARSHGVAPMLYLNLKHVCDPAASPPIMEPLGRLYRAYVTRNLYLSGQLLFLLELFESEGIPAISYKGPVLAKSLYGNLSYRFFWDLDILLHKRDVLKAKELLFNEGFLPERRFGKIGERIHLRHDCEYNFDRPEDGLHVEIHWRLMPSYCRIKLDASELWKHHRRIPFAGTEVRNLCDEHLFLLLCAHHGGKHQWRRLSMIVDVAQLICRGPNWLTVLSLAEKANISRMAAIAILLSNDLLDSRIPPYVHAQARRVNRAESMARELASALFPGSSDHVISNRYWLTHLKMREGLADRIRYIPHILREVFVPSEKEEALLPLPRYLASLHYVVRPLRLIFKYVKEFIENR